MPFACGVSSISRFVSGTLKVMASRARDCALHYIVPYLVSPHQNISHHSFPYHITFLSTPHHNPYFHSTPLLISTPHYFFTLHLSFPHHTSPFLTTLLPSIPFLSSPHQHHIIAATTPPSKSLCLANASSECRYPSPEKW